MLTYIDCGSGVAGDMLLGALTGLGLSSRALEKTLKAAIREKDWKLKIEATERQLWPGWSVQVIGDRTYGSLEEMKSCVRKAPLPAEVKRNALEIFARLQKAETQAHRHGSGEFDPQGLGLMDTLVDVIGVCWGFWKMGITQVQASPIRTGRVAPATAAMLKDAQVPIYTNTTATELATPTGVSILLQFAKFKPLPEIQLEKAGYGAGQKDTPERPNILAIYQGKLKPHPQPLSRWERGEESPLLSGEGGRRPGEAPLEKVLLLGTVIDDMDPRLYPHVMDLILKAGALDVWWSPIGMKKGRPGIQLTVLCRPESEAALRDLLFQETTTLGIRRQPVDRWVLPRQAGGLKKRAFLPGGQVKSQVEFEKAKQIASHRAIPLVKLLK
jgi:pyridinium-3,5-bisthiocarboxylic acid mononucleotide nickel chelatase